MGSSHRSNAQPLSAIFFSELVVLPVQHAIPEKSLNSNLRLAFRRFVRGKGYAAVKNFVDNAQQVVVQLAAVLTFVLRVTRAAVSGVGQICLGSSV